GAYRQHGSRPRLGSAEVDHKRGCGGILARPPEGPGKHRRGGQVQPPASTQGNDTVAQRSAHPLIIAIDGPSGAGKGTVARTVAARLKYRHVDTGAMYRAVAWKALHEGVVVTDEAAVAAIGERATFDLEGGRVGIDGYDVASAIRT